MRMSLSRAKQKSTHNHTTGPLSGWATTSGTHHRELFASCFPEGLSPPDLAWVPLLLEVLVTLGLAESEHLQDTPVKR